MKYDATQIKLNQTWSTIKWLELKQNHLDKIINLNSLTSNETNYVGIYSNIDEKIKLKTKSNKINSQLGLRREINQLNKNQQIKFHKLHDQWVDRSFVKSRFEPWTASPSEEQIIWILSRLHPQLVGSASESVFNLLAHQTEAKNKHKKLAHLEAQSIIRPRKQTNWSWGLDKLTQGDRLQHARQLEREVKAISPNLLRYNRYLQINRDLVYLHKENIQINATIAKANLNQQIKLNQIKEHKEWKEKHQASYSFLTRKQFEKNESDNNESNF